MSKLIELIHRVSGELLNIDDEFQIYQIMNEGIREMLPEAYFLINKLQPDDMNFRITHSFGFDKFIESVQTLLGKNPFEMDFTFNDLDDVKLEAFMSGKLFHFEGGLYDLVNGKINKTICKTIEKILGVSDIYAVSFSVNKKHFGGASIFIPKNTIESGIINKETKLAIETIAYQASLAIKSLRHIEYLRKKEDGLISTQSRFKQLVSMMNDIVWKANGDGTQIIDLNNSFEKYFGYPSSEFTKNRNLWFEVIHPDDKENVRQALKNLFKEVRLNVSIGL